MNNEEPATNTIDKSRKYGLRNESTSDQYNRCTLMGRMAKMMKIAKKNTTGSCNDKCISVYTLRTTANDALAVIF